MCEWKNPKKELPNDGEVVLIREYYHSPKHGIYRNNYRVMTFTIKHGFELEEAINKRKCGFYRITHWMKIPELNGTKEKRPPQFAPMTSVTEKYVMDDYVFKVDIPRLITEWETSTHYAPYHPVFASMRYVLQQLTQRAIELDDPALNIIMLYTGLFDASHHPKIREIIESQRERIRILKNK